MEGAGLAQLKKNLPNDNFAKNGYLFFLMFGVTQETLKQKGQKCTTEEASDLRSLRECRLPCSHRVGFTV